MIKVAITGGIGSGKSTVSRIIKDMGYTVIDCDEIADAYLLRQSVIKKIKEFIPECVKEVNGEYVLDIPIFKNALFTDSEKRKKLNSLVHPAVMRICVEQMENSGKKIAFAEVPVLFENGFEKNFDKVIVVSRDTESRIKSVSERSSLTRNETIARINAQYDYSKLPENCIVIENNGTESNLYQAVNKAIAQL